MFDKIEKKVKKVLKLDPIVSQLDSNEIKMRISEIGKKLKEIKSNRKRNEIEIELYALLREAANRVLKKKPYPVQIYGGFVLGQGEIAEMKTGEGKTLVATLPAIEKALAGKKVHIVTVNDYLAKRDAEIMEPLYKFAGLTVGCVSSDMDKKERRKMYDCDIVYGTNSNFGFDYLRDNMVFDIGEKIQGKLDFVIVDEIDSVLIDEAKTPLLISAKSQDEEIPYREIDEIVDTLTEGELPKERTKMDEMVEENENDVLLMKDYAIDYQRKLIHITDGGIQKIETALEINLEKKPEIMHLINNSIRAKKMMKKDKDYVIKNGEIQIVDEYTGRIMEGRTFSMGLHQAIEAKEGVEIKGENETVAMITIQNFFKMYECLSGMSGTAKSEEKEFKEVYGLKVREVKTNKPIARKDYPEILFYTEDDKMNYLLEMVYKKHQAGQPILIGTPSIEKSEKISKMLWERMIEHKVLNAINEKEEAQIIAQAGMPGAVTIATNMAGRGTDILLGGNPKQMALDYYKGNIYSENLIDKVAKETNENLAASQVRNEIESNIEYFEKAAKANANIVHSLGGLCVINTEKNDALRIDNQLKGRAGRQGDAGESYLLSSMEDEMIRKIYGEKHKLTQTGIVNDKLLKKVVGKIQSKNEKQGFEARKNLVEYDNVNDIVRKRFYKKRDAVLVLYSKEELKPFYKKCNEEDLKDYSSAYLKNLLIQTLDDLWIKTLNDLENLKTSVSMMMLGAGKQIDEYKMQSLEIYEKNMGMLETILGEKIELEIFGAKYFGEEIENEPEIKKEIVLNENYFDLKEDSFEF